MKKTRINKLKFLGLLVFVAIVVLFVINTTKLFQKPTDTFVVEKGSISFEEETIRIYNQR